MQIPFIKYHGTGNDFILIDDRAGSFNEPPAMIARICDRHFGVGADGLLLLRNSKGFDFEMVYYNSDGSTATFCGNGGRCIVAFAQRLGIIGKKCRFKAPDMEHSATIVSHNDYELMVSLQMLDPIIYENTPDFIYLNTGTYHYVTFVEDPDSVDIIRQAGRIRYDQRFAPHGTNVNYVKIEGDQLTVRTYEKGVENETLSCGTGVTASAIAASLRNGGLRWTVHTKGGDLQVEFTREAEKFTQVYLQGPATLVFDGFLSI
jgi:diaminopimelate epimerase